MTKVDYLVELRQIGKKVWVNHCVRSSISCARKQLKHEKSLSDTDWIFRIVRRTITHTIVK